MMEFIEAKDPEWMQMWEQLAQEALNKGDPICAFLGRSWEYMGSTDDHHHLRHLLHPGTGKTEYMYLERRKAAAIAWAS